MSAFADIVRSELVKLRSVRSTWWTLGAAVAFNVVLAAALAIFLPEQLSAHQKATLDVLRVSLGGIHLSQVAFGVLGVLVITGEYAAGTIRATLSAVPRRRTLLAAKLTVLTATALAVGIGSSLAAFWVFQALLSDGGLTASIADPGVLRALVGGGLFLTALAAMGLGLGAITRASTGAIAALFSLLFVPPILLELVPDAWRTTIGPYMPMEAGSAIYSLSSHDGALGPWTGFGVFSAYASIALAAGFVLITRRDA